MSFEERLPEIRKSCGMSQEALAEKIGVSRQAVSKWETGEALPDYAKLIALADVLEVSLDNLCGRNGENTQIIEVPAVQTSAKKRKVWPWLVGILAALILVGTGVLIGWSVSHNAVKEPLELPEEFFVKDVSFTYVEGEGLHFQFTPSVAGRGYIYYFEVLYADESSIHTQRAEAEYKRGVCSGVIKLEPRPDGYSGCFVISNGFEALRARNRFGLYHDGIPD